KYFTYSSKCFLVSLESCPTFPNSLSAFLPCGNKTRPRPAAQGRPPQPEQANASLPGAARLKGESLLGRGLCRRNKKAQWRHVPRAFLCTIPLKVPMYAQRENAGHAFGLQMFLTMLRPHFLFQGQCSFDSAPNTGKNTRTRVASNVRSAALLPHEGAGNIV